MPLVSIPKQQSTVSGTFCPEGEVGHSRHSNWCVPSSLVNPKRKRWVWWLEPGLIPPTQAEQTLKTQTHIWKGNPSKDETEARIICNELNTVGFAFLLWESQHWVSMWHSVCLLQYLSGCDTLSILKAWIVSYHYYFPGPDIEANTEPMVKGVY